jgi:hypothetical protein
MIILLVVVAAIITGVPLVAVVLVTIASLREDAGRTLTSRAPNRLDAAARRLLSFQPSGPGRGGSRGARGVVHPGQHQRGVRGVVHPGQHQRGVRGVVPPGQHGRVARRAPRRRQAGDEADTRPLTGPRA